MKRVRNENEQAQTRERMRRRHAEHTAKATDKGRDAFRVSRLSVAQLQFLWEKMGQHHISNGCEIITIQHVKGYPRLTLQGFDPQEKDANREVSPDKLLYASHVAAVAHANFPSLATDECSHLCHNAACVNPDHLVWESHQMNTSRINCVGSVTCKCGNETILCRHTPKCLTRK